MVPSFPTLWPLSSVPWPENAGYGAFTANQTPPGKKEILRTITPIWGESSPEKLPSMPWLKMILISSFHTSTAIIANFLTIFLPLHGSTPFLARISFEKWISPSSIPMRSSLTNNSWKEKSDQKNFFQLNQELLLLQICHWVNPVLVVCVYSYKTSMSNITPGVSIVSCLKFVRLNARFVRLNARFAIVNARKWYPRVLPESVCKTKRTSSLFNFSKSVFAFTIHLKFNKKRGYGASGRLGQKVRWRYPEYSFEWRSGCNLQRRPISVKSGSTGYPGRNI